jgi:hypothetical protein
MTAVSRATHIKSFEIQNFELLNPSVVSVVSTVYRSAAISLMNTKNRLKHVVE